MYKYKVTVIGISMVDWQSIQFELFNGAQTIWSEFGGQSGEFHFDTQPQISDLGKLIKIQTIE